MNLNITSTETLIFQAGFPIWNDVTSQVKGNNLWIFCFLQKVLTISLRYKLKHVYYQFNSRVQTEKRVPSDFHYGGKKRIKVNWIFLLLIHLSSYKTSKENKNVFYEFGDMNKVVSYEDLLNKNHL